MNWRTGWLGTLVVCAMLLAGAAAGVAALRWNRYHLPFEAAAWKAAPRDLRDDTRHRMLRSLLREYPLVGATREEIVELLGPGSDAPLFGEYDLRYPLGPEFGQLSRDRLWLLIRIEADGRASDYRLGRQ